MKNYLFILMLAPTIAMTTVDGNMSNISKAISSGDAETLSKYFDESIEVAVLDIEDVFDKPQATKVVKDFFSKNKPKSFSSIHEGTSKGNDSRYLIGDLSTGGSSFRVYLYLKVDGGNLLIQEIRFDEE